MISFSNDACAAVALTSPDRIPAKTGANSAANFCQSSVDFAVASLFATSGLINGFG